MSHFQWTITSEEGVMWVVGKCWKLKPYAIIVISEENNSFQSQECGGQSILSFLNFADFALLLRSWLRQHATLYEKKLQFTTEQRGQKFASDLSYSLFFKQVVIVFCSEYNICCYMFCRTEIIWVHGMTSRCIQRKTPPIRFCKTQTQANNDKHIYSKTNRGRPQQFGFSTRTNQVIQSHVF